MREGQLSRFEQQAIATAAGISDMTVAARLFGGTNSEFAKTQMSMKEMQERAAKAQAVQEKFTQVMQSFAIALGPVVTALGAVADALIIVLNPFTEVLKMEGELGGFLNSITAGIYLLAAAWKVLGASTLVALAPFVAAIGIFTGFLSLTEGLSAGLKILAGALFMLISPLIAVGAAAALAAAVPSAGLSLILYTTAAAGLSAFAAGLVTTIQGIGEYSIGKPSGQSVGGGAALVGEKGQEMVVTEDGSRYMVNSPSVMALDTQDTVYSNAETKAMMNGGGNNNNTEQLALMRQQQSEFMQSMREERAMLQRSITELANRPNRIELDGKQVYKGQREYMLKDPNLRIV
jgi:hypothetical protein